MGLIGLFVGAVILSLGFKVFQEWLNVSPDDSITTDKPKALPG
jgi:hypothetical protein